MDVNRPAYVILFTAAITAAFTAAVTSVQALTQARIDRNRELRRQRSLVAVFNLGDVERLSDDEVGELFRERIREDAQPIRDPKTGAVFQPFRVFRTDDTLGPLDGVEAVAFRIAGSGLWAPIRGFLALEADLRTIRGVVFVDHKETPGLGGRITEKWFQEQFRGLKVPLSDEEDMLLYVTGDTPRGPADPRYGRAVDAITGATQTSRFVERFLNRNLKQFRRAFRESMTQRH